jgi:lantibiotic modifying enzyme
LNGYIEYLLCQQKDDNSGLHFSSNINKSNSILQWNYGDLAVAYTLYQAGIINNNKEWKAIAIEMALRTTAIKETENDNAGIYSGTMGIAHLYNHFYQNTLNMEFKRAAEYWIDKILSTIIVDGVIGFSIPLTKDNEPELGILKGLAGIGLALISSIADFQPNWDGCLGMQKIDYPAK